MIGQQRIQVDQGAKEGILAICIILAFFNNSLFLIGSLLCFSFLFYRLQQPLKPSVFTIIFIYHFLQVIAYIILSNVTGEDLDFRSPSMSLAIFLSLLGFFFLFGPVIYYQNKLPVLSVEVLRQHARKLSTRKTFQAYVVSFFAVNSLSVIALSLGGFAQVVFSLLSLKWALFTLFGLQVLLKKQMKRAFYLVIVAEFAIGFFSYFSNFKTVLFFTGFVYMTFLHRIYLKHILTCLLVCALAFFMGVMWTSIKKEYRAFLNGGTNTQVVAVSKDEALDKILELSSKQEGATFDASVNDFLLRLQYTYHLAKTMDRVPSVIPYQNGKNWGQTLAFVLTPRLFNPDKGTYDATSKTTYYTGIRYMGSNYGTSFSLGYFGDSYIDFGPWGMWIPLLILGTIYGSTYYYFLRHSSSNFLFNYAVVAAIFMEFVAFEMDATYLLGRLFSTLLVFFIFRTFFFKSFYQFIRQHENDVPERKRKAFLAMK